MVVSRKAEKSKRNRNGRWVLLGAVVLFILHQDLWYWNDTRLVLGFLPIGLAYHALYSVVAAALWAVAVKVAWPHHIEAFADGEEPDAAAERSVSS